MKRRVFEFKEGSLNILRRRSALTFTASFDNTTLIRDISTASLAPTSLILKRQEPPMELVDEIVFLLHTAAEIEHSLMVQYLYAA